MTISISEADNQTLLAGNLVPLVLLVLVVGVALFWKRRRLVPFAKKTKHGKADTMSVADSEVVTNRPVKLKDFADHYRIMSADSDFRFSEEFELLKNIGRDKPCNAADLPVNRPKNRFTNILPYDHSRIKLMPTDDEEGTDYINANYIPGYNSPREFIVTQGPLHSTRDDLWRMIWEQNCRAIVMLTRCIEKGREKCDHYWPFDMQPVYYGDIQVILLNESQYSHWTISEFKVSRNEQSRILKHFHFTTWPDFGVPEPAQVLVKFVRTFRERIGYDPKPIVVHCSAGVGRSGTFIALDRVLQHIQKHDYVDIFGIVSEMRKERVWMVQNEQQYICVHQCLQCVLEKKEEFLELGRPEAHDNQGYDDDEGIAESGI
ncbi:tyrosine-protein phosphatase 10D [Parasteatoda tepidariorum]|uniref:tyrosine-protein phosphatase 10D n=1 Tax=Parasteatoda tepidariorum TaxID=114398 RepID=UPI0039BD27CD